MNTLVGLIVSNLESIDQGLRGIITLSEKLEGVISEVFMNKVPTSWSNAAYPSRRGLTSWLMNLFQRCEQLKAF